MPNFIFCPAIAVILIYSCENNIVNKLLSSVIFVSLGEISYSVYLLQGTVLGAIVGYSYGNIIPWIAISLTAVTAASILTWLSIERPFRWLLRRLAIRAPD